MNYNETIEYLYGAMPAFHDKGAGAYKPGLERTLALAGVYGNPHEKIRTVHVAGTNGKGSTAHSLAAVLQKSGYRTGLYTSPHLWDFRERIRVDGEMISREEVVDFVARYIAADAGLRPSFFELVTVMAFDHFARRGVDVAVIETGLGGRLDSTNIITPEVAVITNISMDHTDLLGDTPAAIAAEKAGIIKAGVPVVIGEAGDPAVRRVFEEKAAEEGSEIFFAEEEEPLAGYVMHDDGIEYGLTSYGPLRSDLSGSCQPKNMATILTALHRLENAGFDRVRRETVCTGLADVTGITHLAGRWMKVGDSPLTICDTGHNEGGWRYIADRLASMGGHKHVVIGMVGDKDHDAVLSHLARVGNTTCYFTRPGVERGFPARELAECGRRHGLTGEVFETVGEALKAARAAAGAEDVVFVGGSTFVVAELDSL